MKEVTFEYIELDKIRLSDTNPRKIINEDTIKNLADSIKLHGVLHPIIVRPIPNILGYVVVSGERRLRASIIANQKTIPATIKNISDEEAFEIQIVENLEREDVHPLHESEAFKTMLDSGRYTIDDVAAKIAKTNSYIAQRLKMNDLIPEIKIDFLNNEMGIGHAVLLAKLTDDEQKDIYENYKNSYRVSAGYGTITCLKDEIKDYTEDLENAVFDINDKKLIDNAPACVFCPKCSRANPTLFPEDDQNICYDKKCFSEKERKHIASVIENTIEIEPDIVFISDFYDGKPKKYISKTLENNNLSILYRNADYKEIFNGNLRGFFLDGPRIGTITNIEINNNCSSNPEEAVVENEIIKIEQRAERALELDREKIYKRIIDEIITDSNELVNNSPLTKEEKAAVIYRTAGYSERKEIERDFKCNTHYGIKLYNAIHEHLTPDLFSKYLRMFIYNNLVSKGILDFVKQGESAAIYNIVNAYHPEKVELFTIEQNEIANKRIERTNKRIEELKVEDNANN